MEDAMTTHQEKGRNEENIHDEVRKNKTEDKINHESAEVDPAVDSRRRKGIILIVLLLVILLIVYLGIGAYAAAVLTKPDRNFDPALNPGAFNLEYEEFTYPARGDGVEIAAWYIPSEENERAIILVHGTNNSRTNGFIDQFVPFAARLHAAGFSVLMIDLRGHGQSGDARLTFGIKERWDILGGVDWLRARGYSPGKIGVLGYSLGAGSVIGATAEDEAIGAVWLDSAYVDIDSVLEHSWRTLSGLPQVFWYPTKWMARLLYGVDFNASRPVDEIGKIAPRPIFMAHCKKDPLILISHMDRLLAAAQNTKTWVIENCDERTLGLEEEVVPKVFNNHAIGYYVQPEEYGRRVIQFFDESLK
jgi:uncharacterized protein